LVATVPVVAERLAFGRGGLLAVEIVANRFNAVRPPGAGGSAPEIVDPANGRSWSPAYSPDGTLAVVSDRSGGAGVWLSRPGTPARLLTGLGNGSGDDLSWSPDGASLAFSAARDGKVGTSVVGPAGEERARIPVAGVYAGRPAWSADARSLTFPVRDGGGWRLWRADLARPARPWPITGYGWAAVGARGDTLYAMRSDRPGLWRLDTTPRRVAAGFSGRSPDRWTLYGNEVVFGGDGGTGRRRLLSVALSGGVARPFADLPGASRHLDFAIDPRSGKPTYIAVLSADTDIELFHLSRR
ncbi:MAG: TolB family protein, partial [Caulobacteraceae bacterium]